MNWNKGMGTRLCKASHVPSWSMVFSSVYPSMCHGTLYIRRRRRRRLEAVLLLLQRKRERRRTGKLKETTTTSKKGGKKERKRTPACPARPGSCRCCCLITRRLFTATHARTTGRHVFIQQLQMTKESAAASLRQGKNFISHPLPQYQIT